MYRMPYCYAIIPDMHRLLFDRLLYEKVDTENSSVRRSIEEILQYNLSYDKQLRASMKDNTLNGKPVCSLIQTISMAFRVS